jgi:mono/diheme cytochrome c family protein
LGVLHDPRADHYFGTTDIDDMKPMTKLGDEKLAAVTEYLFSLGHEPQDPPFDDTLAAKGKDVFEDKCMDCHLFGDDGAFIFDGPQMKGYASRTWIVEQVRNPEKHYGELDEMPAFEDELSEHDIAMVAAFLRQQRFEEPSQPPAPRAQNAEDDADDEAEEASEENAPADAAPVDAGGKDAAPSGQ